MSSLNQDARILVVDDSQDTLDVLRRNLLAEGYQVYTALGVTEAIHLLEEYRVDLIITDMKIPKISGLELVRHVRENYKDTEIIVITGYPSVEGAIQAVKGGAEEYLPKPFTEEELLGAVRRALDTLAMRKKGRSSPLASRSALAGLIGESEGMRDVFSAITKAAPSEATVLITGESGTGKELVARAIHYQSPRAAAPFVPVNCGGIPEGLLESELFGHVKGAFTGATYSRAGFFHAADGGSLFLDEVSETGAAMQIKLLRALQDKEIVMVGSNRTRKVDVRFIAATNKDLHSLIQQGGFRDDLFYRLNVISIPIPPLRERGTDIALLAGHFASKYAAENGKSTPRFSDQALFVLKNYNWPGNVRELENVIQRLVVMAEEEVIEVPDLPSLMRFSALHGTTLDMTLAEVEAEHIRNVLASVAGNKTRAAAILGIDRKTMRTKLNRSLNV